MPACRTSLVGRKLHNNFNLDPVPLTFDLHVGFHVPEMLTGMCSNAPIYVERGESFKMPACRTSLVGRKLHNNFNLDPVPLTFDLHVGFHVPEMLLVTGMCSNAPISQIYILAYFL